MPSGRWCVTWRTNDIALRTSLSSVPLGLSTAHYFEAVACRHELAINIIIALHAREGEYHHFEAD